MNTDLIRSDPAVLMGKPVVAGTRITVELILEKLAAGETFDQIDEFIGDLPGLEGFGHAGRREDRHECQVESTFPGPGKVELACRHGSPEVCRLAVQPIGSIDVRVDDEVALGQRLRPIVQAVSACRQENGGSEPDPAQPVVATRFRS